MSRLILVTGGARSGKSDFAQQLAGATGEEVVFIATAEALDEDMARRIAAHRQARPAAWLTIECPRRLDEALRSVGSARTVVVDCLTMLVSNVLLSLGDEPNAEDAAQSVNEEVRLLIDVGKKFSGTVIVVTNEVGLGIVPANPLARLFRDLLGRANAALAQEADLVYLMVSGLPLEIKSLTKPK
jgi:adenosylcobinamide kinase/adenosylcobinamide-phosphate guanylyltransferase